MEGGKEGMAGEKVLSIDEDVVQDRHWQAPCNPRVVVQGAER